MAENETINQDYIELEGPNFLVEGQNFYDQQPFKNALQKLSNKYDTPIEKLAEILSFVARYGQKPHEDLSPVLRQHLEKYPYWNQYIKEQRLSYYYRSDGGFSTRNKQTGNYVPTPSYIKWVSDLIKAEKSARLWGIEEIFPQDFAGTSSALPDLPQTKPSTRIWRIRRIAETTKEK